MKKVGKTQFGKNELLQQVCVFFVFLLLLVFPQSHQNERPYHFCKFLIKRIVLSLRFWINVISGDLHSFNEEVQSITVNTKITVSYKLIFHNVQKRKVKSSDKFILTPGLENSPCYAYVDFVMHFVNINLISVEFASNLLCFFGSFCYAF